MKRILFVFFICVSGFSVWAQKPVIDSSVYGKWPTLEFPKISNDGKYALYWVTNDPTGGWTLVLISTFGNWKVKLQFKKEVYATFTSDSRKAIVGLPGDSLGIFLLHKGTVQYLSHVRDFRIMKSINQEWLIYHSGLPGEGCVIQSVITDKSYLEAGVTNYFFNENGDDVILEIKANDSIHRRLVLLELLNGKRNSFWIGGRCSQYRFDHTGKRFAFLTMARNGNVAHYNIWDYEVGNGKADLVVNDLSLGQREGFSVANGPLYFSKDDQKLYFKIGRVDSSSALRKADDGVKIWNYKDKYLQSVREHRPATSVLAEDCVINLLSGKIIVLNGADEVVLYLNSNKKEDDKNVLVFRRETPDAYYDKEARSPLYVESVEDGSRRMVKQYYNFNGFAIPYPILSPDEKFVIWYDLDDTVYYSYEVRTGIRRSLSVSLPEMLYDDEALRIGRYNCFGIAGWRPEDSGILIYDQFDIWDVDPRGERRPVNITNNVGRDEHIVFGLIHPGSDAPGETIPVKGGILMDGYNKDTKENGFWILNNDFHTRPEKCNMDAHSYWIERVGGIGHFDFKSAGRPIKALGAYTYLVTRMSSYESPNLFVTRDFKSFRALSEICPERKFNWMKSELVSWRMSDGRMSQGVLYKPENFDSKRKYPLIFNYYERKSDQLNEYLVPDYSHNDIDIPTFVSKGYLVFVPDIHFVARKGGWSVLNSVLSAAKFLISLPWVDSAKLGLEGHSYGGWATNFLITHSQLFRAACSAAGSSDAISAFGELRYGVGDIRQRIIYELYQGPYGLGVTPWSAPEAYVENSPIFYIDSIVTPLLIVHGRVDDVVPFEQAIELFTGMKRAGKKVWLLEYEKEDHSFYGSSAKDYTARMQQFFDHYLMGEPAPLWMTDVQAP